MVLCGKYFRLENNRFFLRVIKQENYEVDYLLFNDSKDISHKIKNNDFVVINCNDNLEIDTIELLNC